MTNFIYSFIINKENNFHVLNNFVYLFSKDGVIDKVVIDNGLLIAVLVDSF